MSTLKELEGIRMIFDPPHGLESSQLHCFQATSCRMLKKQFPAFPDPAIV